MSLLTALRSTRTEPTFPLQLLTHRTVVAMLEVFIPGSFSLSHLQRFSPSEDTTMNFWMRLIRSTSPTSTILYQQVPTLVWTPEMHAKTTKALPVSGASTTLSTDSPLTRVKVLVVPFMTRLTTRFWLSRRSSVVLTQHGVRAL